MSNTTTDTATLPAPSLDAALLADSVDATSDVTGPAMDAIGGVNSLPTGSVTIAGTAAQNQTLSVSTSTLADADGMGTKSYQWLRDGVAISGATGTTYRLTQADVGQAITVRVSYTDGGGRPESVTSAATTPVANVNDAPSGSVTISGTATQGHTLTASNTLADVDGMGSVSYQWLRAGVAIAGATGASYTLTQDDVDRSIAVRATYVDGYSTTETRNSTGTVAVVNVNDAPTGELTVNGSAIQGLTLTATHTVRDPDGLGSLRYQWLRDGAVILNATSTSYKLTQADVGHAISVQLSYTDGQGTAERVTSTATEAVANLNDAPTGSVSILGTATQHQVLTASSSLADIDGLGALSYQWLRGGVAIAGATGTSYLLTQADVATNISVRVSYTDAHGTAESATSSARLVGDFNDPPVGEVTIIGDAELGNYLEASHTLSDIDGLGAVSWQWLRNGVAISGAVYNFYPLTSADVGAAISVKATYTDGSGWRHTVTSEAKVAVDYTNETALSGTAGNDVLNGGVGNSPINGLAGNDTVHGGSGADSIDGGDGDDWLYGDSGNDSMAGGSGNDVLVGGTGRDIFTGGGGNDVFVIQSLADTGTFWATMDTITDFVRGQDRLDLGGIDANRDAAGQQGFNALIGSAEAFTAAGQLKLSAGVLYGNTDADADAEFAITLSGVSSLSLSDFILGASPNNAPTGTVTLSGTAEQGQTLTAVTSAVADADGLGAFSYQWLRGGTAVAGATGASYTLTQADVGRAITVRVSYTDLLGTAESLASAATAAVANVNDAPTGHVSINGTVAQGYTLTAVTSALADADGLGAFSYQWLRGGSDVAGATGASYTLTAADAGQAIAVRVSYTDGFGTAESRTSLPAGTVPGVNTPPTGTVVLSGTAEEGGTLTASHTLDDADGLGVVSWQWLRGGAVITGATAASYTLTQADVGRSITVRASYVDGLGKAESVTSAATAPVANVNDAPTGGVTISGTAVQGQTLSVRHTLSDADGLGTLSWQWLRDGEAITGATSTAYRLTLADVGHAITARVSWVDGRGTAESVSSAATAPVLHTNAAPTGSVTISGPALEGETLTASNTLEDADGLGAVSYQWLRAGVAIDGATGASYTLTQADVGRSIAVRASYTDGHGVAESRNSAGTVAVVNVNDAPTGEVSISGTAEQGQTLVVGHTLADPDGLGALRYQWLRDGEAITGAGSSSYRLTQADVGHAITARVSWVDGRGTAQAVSSAATAAVANVNDAPTGNVYIQGTATQYQTLTAATGTLRDVDGLGTLSFQWLRAGVAIDGATAESYTLTQADAGQAITVRVSYTDGFGTAESKTSAPTARVYDFNDLPTGELTFSGTAEEGQTLTLTNTLSDPDGMHALRYQWLRGGYAISGATGESYVLTQADVGKAISVRATYVDDLNRTQHVTSAATASVGNVNDAPTGDVFINGTALQGQALTLSHTLRDGDGMGTPRYQWLRDGEDIGGATSTYYRLTQADVGHAITARVSWVDGRGTAESVTSAATAPVVNHNDAPLGVVTVSGPALEGETLSVSNTLSDADGLGAVSYQWLRSGVAIDGATGTSYALTQADVGRSIAVRASYTDGHGVAESRTSAATAVVSNVNDAPTGSVTIAGTAEQGQTLAIGHTLADEDGLGTLRYQWLRDGEAITGAGSSSYRLAQADVGHAITARVSWVDGRGTAEAVSSAATAVVANVNDAPTGSVTIAGTATQGQTLTAVTSTLRDADGLGELSYQWLRGGEAIDGATATTYRLTQADVGQAITVRVSYTDGFGLAESKTSYGVRAYNLNDAPTGDVTVSGEAELGRTLSASHTLADTDGLGAVRWQWLRNGVAISGANVETYTLTAADLNKTIAVKVSYVDGFGRTESVTSAALVPGVHPGERLVGDAGGVPVDDVLHGRGVASHIDGRAGSDYLWGNAGDDSLIGGSGNDSLFGSGGSDFLWGDDGDDLLVAGPGQDWLRGGSGRDVFVFQSEADLGPTLATRDVIHDFVRGQDRIDLSGIDADTGTAGHERFSAVISSTADFTAAGQLKVSGGVLYGNTDADAEAEFAIGLDNVTGVSLSDFILARGANVAPTGGIGISGTAAEHQTLTAVTRTLADADGLDTFGYQWLRDGVAIDGATAASYTLTRDDVGQAITVRVSYTDGYGTAESRTSPATAPVGNVNDAPTGGVTVTGNPVVGESLSAAHTLADLDGMGPVSWQWLRNGTAISGATGNAYTLTTADVGKLISVKASYVDGFSRSESVTSSPTAAVAQPTDTLVGDAGGVPTDDVLSGGAGASIIRGRAGNDLISGNAGDDGLYGGTGNDTLHGGAGNDLLSGGEGDDLLVGGPGRDWIEGGEGADVFLFQSEADMGTTTLTRDTVIDFVQGEDRIDLADLDADTAAAGHQGFDDFIDAAAAFTAAGQLRLSGGVLYGNTDADASAEFAIELVGVTSLDLSDFVLVR